MLLYTLQCTPTPHISSLKGQEHRRFEILSKPDGSASPTTLTYLSLSIYSALNVSSLRIDGSRKYYLRSRLMAD